MNSPINTFEEQNYRRFDPFFYGEGTPDFGPNGDDAFAYLDDKYDQSVIPMQTEEDALPMIAEINLRNILEVDEATMTIIVETTLRFIWTYDRNQSINQYLFVTVHDNGTFTRKERNTN